MCFPRIRLVEQTEHEFHPLECLEKERKKRVITQRRSGASQHMTKTSIILICLYIQCMTLKI